LKQSRLQGFEFFNFENLEAQHANGHGATGLMPAVPETKTNFVQRKLKTLMSSAQMSDLIPGSP
jgi:hypothetical protein